jgi:hypothetical protein
MASISESLIQGLLQPSLNFQNLQEPLGMILGGAQAQKAREERQKGLMTQALGAPDMNAFQRIIEQARTPEERQQALSAFSIGQQQRNAEREQKRQVATELEQESELINARLAAQDIARSNGDYGRARALRTAPMASVQKYIESQFDDKNPTLVSVAGGVAYWDRKQKRLVFEPTGGATGGGAPGTSPGGYNPDAKSKGQRDYTTPDGKVLSLSAYDDGTVVYNGKRVLPDLAGLVQVNQPKRTQNIENKQQEADDKQRTAATMAAKAENAAKVMEDASFLRRGRLGKIFGTALEEAGIADEVSAARRDLFALTGSEALRYLPPGPASNADLLFAINMAQNAQDMNEEQQQRFLRGYAAARRAEAEYYQRMKSHISQKSTLEGFAETEELKALEQQTEANNNKIIEIVGSSNTKGLVVINQGFQKIANDTDMSPEQKKKAINDIVVANAGKLKEKGRDAFQKLAEAYKQNIDSEVQIPSLRRRISDFNRRNP